MNQVSLSDTCYVYFGTSSASTGAATNADSTPTVVVAEDGTDLGYAPTVTNVATGLYKAQIDATGANGFEAGRRYNAYAVATVGGITGRDGVGEFEVLATDLNTGVASVQGNVTGSVASVTGAVGSVTGAVGSVTGLTAANLDVAISTRMATYTQPTGFLAATFPGTVASTTNITAGTITTVTNLTNAPTNGDLTATMKTSVTTAATAATPTAAAVTGAVGSVTAAVTLPTIPTNWITAAGITAAALNGKGDWNIGKTGYTLVSGPLDAAATRTALGLASANLDTQIGTLLTSAAYTAPDNTSITAIKGKTDSLAFTVANKLDVNLLVVNGVTIGGSGTAGSPWGPA